MNTVEPIRDFDLILDIMDYYKGWNERNYVLFCFGIYAPIRISDILKLKVRDVRNKNFISIREKKTGKEQLFPINSVLRGILDHFIETMNDYEFLFSSRQTNGEKYYAAISRQQAYNIINKAADQFGIERIGCHTLRKTFGYHYYQQTKDIMTLQDIFGHVHPSITKRYIGLTQDIKNKAIKDFMYRKLP